MRGYSVEIANINKELTARERIAFKDTSDAIPLDEACDSGAIIINPVTYGTLNVHNEKSENKDYQVHVIVCVDGVKYTTSSDSFMSAFIDIVEELEEAGEDIGELKVYKLPSKNNTGKFITCSII